MSFLSYPNLRVLSIRKIHLIDLIVLGSYYVFCLLLFLSLTGLFKKEFIVLGLAVFFLFLLAVRKRIEFKKHYLYFFILIPILFTGILLIKGCFGGDGIDYWLPWAREIVSQGRMPDFLFNTSRWLASRMPLTPLFQAALFSLFGFRDWVIAILPFFFAAATVFLMYQWLLEKGVPKKYIIFGILLLLTNPLFLDRAGEIGQESFILFFFTAFFYYLEKYQTSRSAPCDSAGIKQKANSHFHFLLAFSSAVLAAVSKEIGFVLFLPLFFLLIKNKQLGRKYFYLFLTFPLFLWLLRNYLIYDNPLFPVLNEIFKGRYYNIFSTINQIFLTLNPPLGGGILARITEVAVSLFSLFCPLGILSFYGFCLPARDVPQGQKKRKIHPVTHNLESPAHSASLDMSNGVHYILLFFISLSIIFFVAGGFDYVRYLMPFLALFIVYGVMGLEKINSRIFLSLIFFLELWGLFFTKLSLSQSQFFAPVERILNNLKDVSQFVYDDRLILALALSIFFFFLLSSRREAAKYLIVLLVATYSVKAVSFNLGSWLNVWLPILGLIFIILVWRFLLKLKEETLQKLVIAYIIILLVVNSWGLATAYFLAHRQFMFPNIAEAYGAQPEAAREIEKLEGENRDFYIYTTTAAYFTWYHNFKQAVFESYTFHIITNLQYHDNLSPSEIHGLFKRSNIKYVIDNANRSRLKPFFDKIESRPDLFGPIFQKEGVYLWRVK